MLLQYFGTLGYEKSTGYPGPLEYAPVALLVSSPLWAVALTPNSFPLALRATRLFALVVMLLPTFTMTATLFVVLKDYSSSQPALAEIGTLMAVEVICVSIVVVLYRLKIQATEKKANLSVKRDAPQAARPLP